jgi:UDP-N-acetylmuramoylalanine--D-glutamate ligase
MRYKMRYKRKIVILGAGESGTGAALLAKQKGYSVFVSDHQAIASPYRQQLVEKDIAFEEGGHSWEKIQDALEVVKSPGVPKEAPIIQLLQKAAIPIIDEIEFASRHTNAFLIAITGSNGKTTTTHLTHHLLQKAGLDVCMAGNMGESFAKKVATENHEYYVLELSSFQLEGIYTFKPAIACLLNITPDHLDRYEHNIQAYADAKYQLVQNMDHTGACIYNTDDIILSSIEITTRVRPNWYPISIQESLAQGAYLAGDNLHFCWKGSNFQVSLKNLPLVGKHNYYNAMAAIAIATLVGIEPIEILTALKTFKGIPHRIEWVGKVQDIDFYNDSKATNVASAQAALESFSAPIIWIAGGYDKGNDYTDLKPLVAKNVKCIVCLGKDNRLLYQAFEEIGKPMYETKTMQAAVEQAIQVAQPQEIVLLSPACASFDLFKDFEDRGNQFRQAVQALAQAKK